MAESSTWIEPNWENVKRVLVIMAHPDDPDFICGGTCALMADSGIEVTYMILTNGDKGNHNPLITREQLIELRKHEQRAAAAHCGVQNCIFMGEEDGFLQSTRDLRYRVVREIRRIRPELCIICEPDRYFVGEGYINHPDHRNAGLVAIDAIFPASDNMMFFPELADEGYPPHKISQIYIWGNDVNNLRIDITDVFARKIAGLKEHVTQFRDINDLDNMSEFWGEKQEDGSMRFYEDFRAMKFE